MIILPDLWLKTTEYGYMANPTIENGVLSRRKYPPLPPNANANSNPNPIRQPMGAARHIWDAVPIKC